MCGLALVAEPLIKLLLTDRWLFCIPFLQISCLTYALYPIHTANLQAINALGRSDLFLKLEVAKKIVGIMLLIISANFGVLAIAYTALLSGVISSYINAFPNKKLINYAYIEQLKDVLNAIIPLISMALVVIAIKFIQMPDILCLFVQSLVGALVYILVSKLSKNESYNYLMGTLKSLIKK